MTYPFQKPPIPHLGFRSLDKATLKAYKQWYLSSLTERIKILEEQVNATPGFEKWKANFSPESLDMLSKWFGQVIEQRDSTPEEIAQALEETKDIIPGLYSPKQFTNKTKAICIDVGMYLSQVFMKHHPSLTWFQILTAKRHADYGQPSLSGFGKRDVFNPFHMVHVQASIAFNLEDRANYTGLRDLYEMWSKFVVPGSEKR